MTSLSTFVCPTRRSAASARINTITVTLPPVILGCGCVAPGGTLTTPGGALGDYAGNLGDPSPGSTGLPTDLTFGGNGTGTIIASRPLCRGATPFGWADRLGFRDVTDGLSNTALVGELHIPAGQLNQFPDDSPLYDGTYFSGFSRVAGVGIPLARGPRDLTASRFSFGSWHPGVCLFGISDGSVRGLSPQVASSVLAAFTHRSNGE